MFVDDEPVQKSVQSLSVLDLALDPAPTSSISESRPAASEPSTHRHLGTVGEPEPQPEHSTSTAIERPRAPCGDHRGLNPGNVESAVNWVEKMVVDKFKNAKLDAGAQAQLRDLARKSLATFQAQACGSERRPVQANAHIKLTAFEQRT